MDSLAPPYNLGVEIEIPDGISRGQRDGLEALLAQAERFLGHTATAQGQPENQVQNDTGRGNKVEPAECLDIRRMYFDSHYPVDNVTGKHKPKPCHQDEEESESQL